MNLWKSDRKLLCATISGAPKGAAVRCALVARLLMAIIACCSTALSQSPTPAKAQATPVPVTAELDPSPAPGEEDGAADPNPVPAAPGPQKDVQDKQKGEKRGSIVVAPIPIS